jgi:PAS domain S-box-containing protein
LYPQDEERVSKEIIHVLKTPGDEFDTSFRILLDNGEIRYIRAVSKTYRDQEGRAQQMVGVNWDITEEKRSEEVRRELAEKYDLILNTTEIGVWDWDLKTNNLSWNDTMYKLFEVSKDTKDKLKDYQAKLYEGDSERMKSNLEKILSGEWEEFESESRLVLSDGSIRYLKAITKIEKDDKGNVGRIYGINLDISELKKSQLELIESKEKAETANKAKSTFLANMSHEIRTPMNAILGFGEILQNNNIDERNQDYITGIIKSGNSLLSLINDILDFSKIEANKMTLNLNSVDIKRIITDVDKIFEFTASKKGIQYYSNIDMNIPPYLILDEGKIKQILINLLGNAVKFTESGSISLDVNFEFNDKDTSKIQLSFSIKDSGIGIDKRKLTSIFNPFEQEDDNDSRKYEGTGLGLSIVKSIAELHNGTVEVESELGKGSTFKVTIHDVSISLMRPNQLSHSTKSDFEKYDVSDKTVLFAEDIESNRNVVQGFLKDYAITVLFAHNGEEALLIARENKIDLAFIDLHMPVMDGMTMAEIWTNDDELKSIPLIALTAEIYDESKQSKNDYFKRYLTKPVRAEDIYDVILVETGMKEESVISNYESIAGELLTTEAQTILISNDLVRTSAKLLKKLNTRELSALIEKIEFLAEMENNDSLREYTRELKLALDTFNVHKIKHLLGLSNNNIQSQI